MKLPEDEVPNFRVERFRYLKQKTRLDLLSVDEALEEIAALVQDAGECCALANEIRDAAKNDLEIAEAEESERLRRIIQPNGKLPSEQAIISMVPLAPRVKQAVKALGDARLDASFWGTMVNALMTKSSAIRTAADLITSGYLTTNFIYEKRRKDIRDVKVKA